MMKDTGRQLDAIERDLVELEAVDRDGVFRRTRLDHRTFFTPEPEVRPRWRWRAARPWMGVAAVLALAVGVWSAMFAVKIGEVHRAKMIAGADGAGVRLAADSSGILGCLSGPSEPALNRCRCHDYDSDGDVDLADIQTFQLAYAGPVTDG